jgi:hypothetical protein
MRSATAFAKGGRLKKPRNNGKPRSQFRRINVLTKEYRGNNFMTAKGNYQTAVNSVPAQAGVQVRRWQIKR